MTEDPILKLAVHLEKHRNRKQAFFSTAAMRALLTKLAAMDEQLVKIIKEFDNLEANWRARPTGTKADRERQLEKELEQTRAARDANFERAEQLEAQVKRLLTKESDRISKVLVQFNFEEHLARQRAWSEQTFGPGGRTKGVSDHIRKELDEIAADPGDLEEWIDIVLLALDGAWRAGFEPRQIVAALAAKQAKNEARQWPDWRTADPDKAVEHIRMDANGNPIPWPESADYFMAFDPANPDIPTD